MLTTLLVVLAQADAPPVSESQGAAVAPEAAEVKVEAPREPPPSACARWKAPGLIEGPLSVGYAAADLALGRRACPRSEVGIGATFGAIIDTPNLYGNLGLQAVIFGSIALGSKTEIFARFDALDTEYVVNSALSGWRSNVGAATLGISRQVYETDSLAGAVGLRVLLPTASNIPGTRDTGAELGHSVSLRATTWLEVHGYAGVGFTVGLGPAPLPALQLVGMLGAAISPVSWFSLVVDLSGGLAGRSFFAPTVGFRFRVFNLGIELGATKPLAGTDRHTAIGGLRLAWRF